MTDVLLWVASGYLLLWVVATVAICISPNRAELDEKPSTRSVENNKGGQ